jgi:serine/threonine protein kinase
MAPELLLHGRASKASDVYAYGILLWEMLTGQRAFKGSPIALLAHRVAKKGARPEWPTDAAVCPMLKALAESCWAQNAALRWVLLCDCLSWVGFLYSDWFSWTFTARSKNVMVLQVCGCF